MPQRTLSEQEFNAIRDSVLRAAPPDMSEADFNRYIPSVMDGAIAEAEQRVGTGLSLQRSQQGSAGRRLITNFGAQVNPLTIARGLWNALPIPQAMGGTGVIEGPKQAAIGIGGAMISEARKVPDLVRQGRYLEAAGRGVAAVVPVLGPAAAAAGEQIGSGDVAGGIGSGLGLVAPFAAKYGLELKRAPNPRKADLLRRDANQTVSQRVLAPGNPRFKATAERIAPEVLSRKLQGSRLELSQIADEGMAAAADAIDTAIASRPSPNVLAVKPIVDALTSRIQEFQAKGTIPTATGKVKHLTALRDYLAKQGANGLVPFEELKRIRDEFYRTADEAKGYQGPDINVPDVGFAAREAGSAIRSHLAKDRPELVGPNADYTFFKRLGDVLDPTLGRPKLVNGTPVGVTGGLATAGAVAGHALSGVPLVGPVIPLALARLLPSIQNVVNSPAWQLAKASKKSALADAIEAGQYGKAKGILLLIAAATPKTENDN